MSIFILLITIGYSENIICRSVIKVLIFVEYSFPFLTVYFLISAGNTDPRKLYEEFFSRFMHLWHAHFETVETA